MNTINASSRLTHFHLHHDGDRDAHEHVRVYDRVHAHVYGCLHVRVYGRAHVHVYDHGYVHARVHRLHGNVHDELYLKAV